MISGTKETLKLMPAALKLVWPFPTPVFTNTTSLWIGSTLQCHARSICDRMHSKHIQRISIFWYDSAFFKIKKILEDIGPFCRATDTSVLDFWWCLPWVSKPRWILCMLSCLCDPQIHLWCNTCWLYRSQHGSRTVLIHVLADMSTSIGGGSGLEPMTICATCGKHGTVNHSATPAQLWPGIWPFQYPKGILLVLALV